MKLDPVLGSSVFAEIPEEDSIQGQTVALQYQEGPPLEKAIPEPSSAPQGMTDSVDRLRSNSRTASSLMANFVTKECLSQGTQNPLCHELSIIDGRQTYRELDKNGNLGKQLNSFPVQKRGLWTMSDWTDTLGEIADNPWVFRGSVNDNYLFTYHSVPEDDRCYWEEYAKAVPLFGGGDKVWKGAVACFEQVLTDKNFNVLSVFTELYPPDGCHAELVQVAIYYDWTKLEGFKPAVLLPVKERITAKVLGQKDLWYANVSWTDYKKFRADHKVSF